MKLAQLVRDLTANAKTIRRSVTALRMRNKELRSEVRKVVAQGTIKPALMKAVSQKLLRLLVRSAASRLESFNLRWKAQREGKILRKVDEDVSSVLMAVSGEATDATRQKDCNVRM